MIHVQHVPITPDFDKYLLDTGEEGWNLFQPMLHRFKGANDIFPHSHPWDFTTTIAKGGYEEEVYTIAEDGSWSVETFLRLPGTIHFVSRNCIHRVVHLLEKECWTFVVPGAGNDDFSWWEWKFDETGICRKRHYETDWKTYK